PRGATQSMDADKLTHRALLWCPAAALQHLARGLAIPCVLCLAAKHHRSAASHIITLKEH
ncbi:MAG: hypothetical protein ABFR19_08880, partial [Pseudomonadota bacterium]